MGKRNKDEAAEAQQKAEEFDKQFEQSKAAGDARAKQDPYRRPQPSSIARTWWGKK
jgi:hypothetical protein